MPRAKINSYEIGSLSPQAVGVPGEDNSGQIINQGVQNLAGAISRREEATDTLAATAKLGDFEYQYTTLKTQLQQQYRDNPKEYAQAVRDASIKLTDEFSKGLNTGVSSKFKQLTGSVLTRDVDNLINWSVAREQEINVGNIKKGYQDLELKAETATTPDDLRRLLGLTHPGEALDEMSLPAHDQRARAFVEEGSVLQLSELSKKAIISNSLDSRIYADAPRTYNDLASGKYNGILSSKEIKTYLNSAKTATINNAVLEQFRSLTTAAVEVAELHDGILAGKVSVADINRRIMWAELHKADTDAKGDLMVPEKYLQGLYTVRDVALNLRPIDKKKYEEEEKAFSVDFERRWDNFLGGRRRGAKPAAQDYDDVLGLYVELEDKYLTGDIGKDTYETKRKLLDTRLKSTLNPKGESASLSEALSGAGKYHWWDNPRDVYSVGYEMIKSYLDKSRPDLTPSQKIQYRDQYLVALTKEINRVPAEQRASIKNKERFVADLLYGPGGGKAPGLLHQLDIYKDPATGRLYKPGQVVADNAGHSFVFLGVNTKGEWMWGMPKDFQEKVGK